MRRIVIDNAVSESVCASLLRGYLDNIQEYGRKNQVDFWSYRVINCHALPAGCEPRTTMEGVGELVVVSISREWGETATIQASQLVSWPTGTSQDAHVDTYFADTRFAAILYLNADYAGGTTFLEMPAVTERVRPAAGRLLVFEGSLIRHGVDEVLAGTRYTNAMWLS